jgi:hypothetical protein
VTSGLHLQPDGAVSKSIIDTTRSQIESSLKVGKTAKLAKYDEVVSVYNKTLLTKFVVPIIDQVSAILLYKLVNTITLTLAGFGEQICK